MLFARYKFRHIEHNTTPCPHFSDLSLVRVWHLLTTLQNGAVSNLYNTNCSGAPSVVWNLHFTPAHLVTFLNPEPSCTTSQRHLVLQDRFGTLSDKSGSLATTSTTCRWVPPAHSPDSPPFFRKLLQLTRSRLARSRWSCEIMKFATSTPASWRGEHFHRGNCSVGVAPKETRYAHLNLITVTRAGAREPRTNWKS